MGKNMAPDQKTPVSLSSNVSILFKLFNMLNEEEKTQLLKMLNVKDSNSNTNVKKPLQIRIGSNIVLKELFNSNNESFIRAFKFMRNKKGVRTFQFNLVDIYVIILFLQKYHVEIHQRYLKLAQKVLEEIVKDTNKKH